MPSSSAPRIEDVVSSNFVEDSDFEAGSALLFDLNNGAKQSNAASDAQFSRQEELTLETKIIDVSTTEDVKTDSNQDPDFSQLALLAAAPGTFKSLICPEPASLDAPDALGGLLADINAAQNGCSSPSENLHDGLQNTSQLDCNALTLLSPKSDLEQDAAISRATAYAVDSQPPSLMDIDTLISEFTHTSRPIPQYEPLISFSPPSSSPNETVSGQTETTKLRPCERSDDSPLVNSHASSSDYQQEPRDSKSQPDNLLHGRDLLGCEFGSQAAVDSEPENRLPSSSPPSSSPPRIFSSSPLPSSQSSAISQSPKNEGHPSPNTSQNSAYDINAFAISSSPQLVIMSTSSTLPTSSPPPLGLFIVGEKQQSEDSAELQVVSLDKEPGPSFPALQLHEPPLTPSVQSNEHPQLAFIADSHPHNLSAVEMPPSAVPPKSNEERVFSQTDQTETYCTPSIKNSGTAKTETAANPKASSAVRLRIIKNKLEHKKLVAPFRSPLISNTAASNTDDLVPSGFDRTRHPVLKKTRLMLPPESTPVITDTPSPLAAPTTATKDELPKATMARTKRAASQFKSPLTAAVAPNVLPSVRLTPTIQALERRLQLLKRAVKVKKDKDEVALECLVKKWTEAGREVAWEVWSHVKDGKSEDGYGSGNRGGNASGDRGAKRGFEDSWGWESTENVKRPNCGGMERNWGWDVTTIKREGDGDGEDEVVERGMSIEVDDEEENKEYTLGTMLVDLKIDPRTLGWDEEEGVFAGE